MSFKHIGGTQLGYNSSDESEFDYVGDQKPRGGRTDSIFDDYVATNSFSLVDSFSEKMKAQHAQAMEAERAEKKIASYYLEVDTLNKLKEWAEATKASYSSIVEKAIQSHLANTTA